MPATFAALAAALVSAIAGCSLIAANDTVTNWLVRGALAEFCGAMVTPWVFFFFVRTLQTGRLHVGLGVATGLLWLSHSVLAYYAGLILGTTYLVLASAGLARWSILDPRTAWRGAAALAVLVGPYLVPLWILGLNYDVYRILSPPYRPASQFRPALSYVWEPRWEFGRTATGIRAAASHLRVAGTSRADGTPSSAVSHANGWTSFPGSAAR